LTTTPAIASRFLEEQRVCRLVPEPLVAEATTLSTASSRARPDGRRVVLGAVSLGGRGPGRAGRTDDRHDRRARRHAPRHPRKHFGERSIDDRHYLSELARKPQAIRHVLPDLLRHDRGRVPKQGKVSPSGRWLAYTSNQSSRFEVYVQPLRPDGRT
jgi:hypothetical protein